ncbi:MAG: flavodoxin family protein [Desulfobacter sp.]|nr:flavodoxin family protein [Desulfobacter sp.]
MGKQVLGISGSPIKNSNTDRLIKAVLARTGCDTEFIKLSQINVRPCIGCKRCVTDNICKVEDDFPALSLKIQNARAIVIGAYTPYGQIDGFTKALLERFWSLRHVNQSLAMELVNYEHMELLDQIIVPGNLPCLSCGKGDQCSQSGVSLMYGREAKTFDYGYFRVEDQSKIWDRAIDLGRTIERRLSA